MNDHGMTQVKPTLCVDFDGVIHSYTNGWQGAATVSDPPVGGALEFLEAASKAFEVHIFSSRSHQRNGIAAMKSWLADELIKAKGKKADMVVISDFVNHTLKWPTVKPSAMVTLDDRAITFEGEFPSIRELLAFKPWNKKEGK